MQASYEPFGPNSWRALSQIEAGMGGRLHVAMHNITTGEQAGYKDSEKCKSASIIKLPMLVHIAMEVHSGARSWSQPMQLTDAEKVDGSGVLTQLTAGLTLTLRDVCMLMITVSDNTATNMLIEAFGVQPFNQRMRSLGFPVTTLFRKAYTPDSAESAPYGLGVTTPYEMCHLMTMLSVTAEAGDAASRECLEILAHQSYREGLPRHLPVGWTYAGKTGAIDKARNDVGLLSREGHERIAVAVFCQDLETVDWSPDNPAYLAMEQIADIAISY